MKLARCPFCGSLDVKIVHALNIVQCSGCFIRVHFPMAVARDGVITARLKKLWNKRVQ